jgi:hypothetical protein
MVRREGIQSGNADQGTGGGGWIARAGLEVNGRIGSCSTARESADLRVASEKRLFAVATRGKGTD